MQKYLIVSLIMLTMLGAGCFSNNLDLRADTQPLPQVPTTTTDYGEGPIYIYTSEQCAYCSTVENAVVKGQVNRKLPVVFREISRDEQNALEMLAVTQKCGLNIAKIGVPFLYDGQNCLEGTDKIMRYIDERMRVFNNEPNR